MTRAEMIAQLEMERDTLNEAIRLLSDRVAPTMATRVQQRRKLTNATPAKKAKKGGKFAVLELMGTEPMNRVQIAERLGETNMNKISNALNQLKGDKYVKLTSKGWVRI
jgi:hypothetical protein